MTFVIESRTRDSKVNARTQRGISTRKKDYSIISRYSARNT